MTRTDYVSIAAALKAARPRGTRPVGIGREAFDAAHKTVDAACLNVAEVLAKDNPLFDLRGLRGCVWGDSANGTGGHVLARGARPRMRNGPGSVRIG